MQRGPRLMISKPFRGLRERSGAGGTRECGTRTSWADDEEANMARWWRRRSPWSGIAVLVLAAPRRTDGACAGAAVATSAVPVVTASPRRKNRAGAARGARHRDALASVAIKTRVDSENHRGPFRGRRPGQAGRPAVHPRQPRDRGRNQTRSRRLSPARRPSSSRRSATSSATPIWSRKMRPPSSRSTMRRPQVNVSRATADSNKAHARRTEGPAQLLHDPRADLRPHQHGQRQGRQFRAPGRHRAARDHQPDRADLCLLHGAAAHLPDLREAIAAETATVEAVIPGDDKRAKRPGHDDREHGRSRDRHGHRPRHHAEQGRTALARHPGQHRADFAERGAASSCRRNAVQVSQTGTFVFVVKDDVATGSAGQGRAQIGAESVIASGLNGGETVVTDGQLCCRTAPRVNVRSAKVAGS